MAEQKGYFSNEIVERLDSILEKSAEIFSSEVKISVSSEDHFSLPEFNGFFYSFDFEDCSGFVKVDWFQADSSMRTFSVDAKEENVVTIQKNFVIPLLKAFWTELYIQFFARISEFSNLHLTTASSVSDFDFSSSIVLTLHLLQISPDDKKTIKILLPKELIFSLLCSRQYPNLETLFQNEIDEIVVNFTQKENVVFVDSESDSADYDLIDNSDFSMPIFSEQEQNLREQRKNNCAALSVFMEGVVKKMQKTFCEYRDGNFQIKIDRTAPYSNSSFAKSIRASDFITGSKIGGYIAYLKWSKPFFARTFLNKAFDEHLEKIECDIFRNEFALPAFDALKSVIEVKIKKYLIITSVGFTDYFDKKKDNFSQEDDGYLVTLLLNSGDDNATADFYFPKETVALLKKSGAFHDFEAEKEVKSTETSAGLKNTEITIGSFIFDDERFNSGKIFLLEKEIGDFVDISRDSKLIARGEVFIRKGKKCVLIKEVFGKNSVLEEKEGE